MVSCAACGCSETPKNKSFGITFHQFPKDERKNKAWVKVIQKENWSPKKSSVLCSQHFDPECFDRSSKLKVRLTQSAVPTVKVDRLKYVRNYNKISRIPIVHTLEVKSVEKNKKQQVENVNEPISLIVLEDDVGNARSGRVASPSLNSCIKNTVSFKPLPSDTPRERFLKKNIYEMQKVNNLRSNQIRRLQKMTWHQKKRISFLKRMTEELKKKEFPVIGT